MEKWFSCNSTVGYDIFTKFAHITKAQLSSDMQNFTVILLLQPGCEQNEHSIEFEWRWKMVSEIDPMVSLNDAPKDNIQQLTHITDIYVTCMRQDATILGSKTVTINVLDMAFWNVTEHKTWSAPFNTKENNESPNITGGRRILKFKKRMRFLNKIHVLRFVNIAPVHNIFLKIVFTLLNVDQFYCLMSIAKFGYYICGFSKWCCSKAKRQHITFAYSVIVDPSTGNYHIAVRISKSTAIDRYATGPLSDAKLMGLVYTAKFDMEEFQGNTYNLLW